MTLPPG
jgi:hypothetical protein